MRAETTTATMAARSGLQTPPSPTLTNPEMILPYGDYDASSEQPYRSISPDPTHIQFSIGSAHSRIDPIATTTPIIYGNGTMLSDIGEVTESESVVGKTRKLPGPAERRMLKQRQNSPLKSSPALGYDAVMKRTKQGTHQRKVSVGSASTVTSEPQQAELFQDFDDGISVDDSVFQGDDEESVADTYAEEIIASETWRLAKAEEANDRDTDRNSSAALSRRAEQILLNAKKRLNNMEGNLNRARSTLLSPTSSSSSIHSSSPLSRSTPSPPSNGRNHTHMAPSKFHQSGASEVSATSPGHSRVYSENSIIPDTSTSPTLTRSASAAARYVGRSKYSPENGLEERGSSALDRPSPPLQIKLQPLSEDEATPEFDSEKSHRNSIRDGCISPGVNANGLTRSTSSMQMRELQDQMEGLKGRLSVLRDRTRSDMKRRSLQSLRTPSPFTAAEQWYTGAKEYGDGNLSADAVVPIHPWNQPPSDKAYGIIRQESVRQPELQQPVYADSDMTSIYEDVSEGYSQSSGSNRIVVEEKEVAEEEIPDEDLWHYNAIAEEQELGEGYDEENVEQVSEEAEEYESDVSQYHDTVTAPLSHEDREDAFDYEHFFLHSAMGTLSQQRHGRRGSYSSEDSVETTRGPSTQSQPERDERTSLGHLRSDSNASVSTFATFATATEGFGSDNEDDDDDDNFAVQQIVSPQHRSTSPSPTAKRSTCSSVNKNGIPNDRQPTPEESSRPNSVIHIGQMFSGHNRQLSSSSLNLPEPRGTARRFPLINRPKGQQFSKSSTHSTPRDRHEHDSILSESITLTEDATPEHTLTTSPVDLLAKDDKLLIEEIVESVGKCVLGLQEAGSSSYEARLWRRRLDAARRVLEGEELIS